QEPGAALNPVLTVGEQVGEGLRHHLGMNRREARTRVAELLAEVGIPDPELRARTYPHELSGGMRQRVLVAMALACEPSLLVADEPTTALDATIRAQILELLSDLRERRGLALLLITHDLGAVAEVCDRVAVMYAGQLVETGPVAEVFEAPAHPYTRGLLDSLPRVGDPGAPLRPIPGVVPPPGRHPPGCRFSDRCPWSWSRCGAEPPPLLDVASPGRSSRCWLVEEGEVPLAAADPEPGP
ncbi:MAG TPA: ABC transporter ATP-binding protein, partial [Longimicrobiales bacterium]|nr:ABC transporter ATP-binding protein [Longimicrobiales bacterium]